MSAGDGLITLYTSHYCGSARAVERILRDHGVAFEVINVDEDAEARRRLMELNGGFASVPTLIWPDGRKLTEPSLPALHRTLGIEEKGLGDRLRSVFRGGR